MLLMDQLAYGSTEPDGMRTFHTMPPETYCEVCRYVHRNKLP